MAKPPEKFPGALRIVRKEGGTGKRLLKAVAEVVAELFDELLLPITSGLEPAVEE